MGRHSASETAERAGPAEPLPSRPPRRLRRPAVVAGVAAASGLCVLGLTLAAGLGPGLGSWAGPWLGSDVGRGADGVNVVLNPTLDDGPAGWTVNPGARLERVPGRSGSAARMSHDDAAPRTIALNDVVNSVSATTAGVRYRAGVWVRVTAPATAGQTVALRVMEYAGSTRRGEQEDRRTLTDTAWHRFELVYQARTTGASLDLNVVAESLPPGVGVEVDDVALVALGPATSTTPTAGAGRSPAATSRPPAAKPSRSTSARSSARSSARTGTGSRPSVTAAGSRGSRSSTRPGWRLVWADEFTGTGVDTARWKVEDHSTYGDGNNELACLMNRPENLSQSGGVLHLVARRERTPVACGSGDSRFPGGRTYTSAHLSTKGKADWTYGRFEVRAKLPTAKGSTKGLWPAFWLRPTAGGTGELDVLEAIGTDGSGNEHTKVHQTVWYDYSGTHPHEPKTVTVPGALPSQAFHVYAVEWERGEIRWYIDDVLTYTRTASTTPWLDDAFDKPFYLRLNLAVGGNWPGAPTSSTRLPASYDVDYVRVYQR